MPFTIKSRRLSTRQINTELFCIAVNNIELEYKGFCFISMNNLHMIFNTLNDLIGINLLGLNVKFKNQC